MKFNQIKLKDIFSIIISFCIFSIILIYMTYSLASNICLKTEMKPYRTEYSSWMGIPTQVETTLENSDGKAEFCIEYYNPDFFDISENIQKSLIYFSNNSRRIE